MACGVPALAFDLPRSGMAWVGGLKAVLGFPQLLREDLTGLIQHFAKDPQLLAEASRAAERRSWSEFSRQIWHRRLADFC